MTSVVGAPRRRGRPSGSSTPLDNDVLLDLALDAFADLGFEGASIRELCRRLGVSHGLVHQRFGSKDQLWYAAMDHGFRHLAGEFADAALGAGDPLVALRRVILRFLEVTAESPALVGVINQESVGGGPRLEHLVDNYLAPAVALLEIALAPLVAEGRVRPVSGGVLYVLIAHGAGGVLSMRALSRSLGLGPLTAGSEEFADYARTVVDLILDGISVRTTDHPRT